MKPKTGLRVRIRKEGQFGLPLHCSMEGEIVKIEEDKPYGITVRLSVGGWNHESTFKKQDLEYIDDLD